MKSYDRNRPLISIHIPKCAGRSFEQVLNGWFKGRLYPHYFDEERARLPKRHNLKALFGGGFKKGVCVHGHFNSARGFGVKDYYPEVDQYITVLRDPFEVAVSNYFYSKRLEGRKALYRDGKAMKSDDDLEEYLKEQKCFFLNFLPFGLTLGNYRDVIERNFIHMGVAEDLQGTVDALAEKLGFPPVAVERKNVSSRTEEVPERLREEYASRHRLEYAIYEYALENYKKP